jgi:hypothetical protein
MKVVDIFLQKVLVEIKKYLPQILWKIDSNKKIVHVAGLLNLNSNKTFKILKWKNILNFAETVEMTAEWYNKYFKNNDVTYHNDRRLLCFDCFINKNDELKKKYSSINNGKCLINMEALGNLYDYMELINQLTEVNDTMFEGKNQNIQTLIQKSNEINKILDL